LTPGDQFERLISIMARLRAPGGCPWDREQTFDSIKPFLLQESYEVMDAIDRRDWEELPGELGDLMLQAVFFSQMAAEQGHFTIEDALRSINEKLVRRHPHVFGEENAATAGEVLKRWDEIKAAEKKDKQQAPQGLLDAVPRALPALVEAEQISTRAANNGFDWRNAGEVLAKLDEERAELAAAKDHSEIEGELGDMLFTLVNLARFHHVDPEQALRRTNAKFRHRFAHVEQGVAAGGKSWKETTLEEMEAFWQAAKQK
jgi:MazG family protein